MNPLQAAIPALKAAKGVARLCLAQRHGPTLHRFLRKVDAEFIGQEAMHLRTTTLSYVQALRAPRVGPFAYRYAASQAEPVLYASIYAALLRHLYRDLPPPGSAENAEWIAYLNSFQSEDGLFRDPAIACAAADRLDYWGWRHLTLHALMALRALGGTPRRRVSYIDPWLSGDHALRWLTSRDWATQPVPVSNAVQNLLTFLQFEREFGGENRAGTVLARMFDWLLERQNPDSAAWGDFRPRRLLPFNKTWSDAAHAGYHIWLPMAYDNVTIPYKESMQECLLRTQNRWGGFGVAPNSTACDDIDTIDPLCRLVPRPGACDGQVAAALRRGLRFVLANRNLDGSYVFLRGVPFAYYHPKMASARDEGALFPTWFRTLSLAFLGQVLNDEPAVRFDWQFLDAPGHQFWRPFR